MAANSCITTYDSILPHSSYQLSFFPRWPIFYFCLAPFLDDIIEAYNNLHVFGEVCYYHIQPI